jgi:hypothetical protein
MRTLLVMLGALLSVGCMGEVSSTPEELAKYDFIAEVKVNPTTPVAGRTVSLNLELLSRSNTLVVVDVVLRAIRQDGTVLHEQVWREVKFHPEEVWNLTQGFVSRNDEKGAFAITIEARESGTDKLLWTGDGPSLSFR